MPVAVAVLLAAPPSWAGASRLQCDSSGKTIRSNAVARVFRVRARSGHVYYGCMRDTARVFRLIRTRSGGPELFTPRLTGAYFAAEHWYFDAQASAVALWDLSTGKRSYWGTGGEDFVGGDIEVTKSGAVAWVTDWQDVWKADADGLAMIGRADKRRKRWKTLKRTGNTLSWRDHGSIASYVLRGAATATSSAGSLARQPSDSR